MATCPKCGSDKFHYELHDSDKQTYSMHYNTGVGSSFILPSGHGVHQSKVTQKAVGFCPDCGYVEAEEETPKKREPWLRKPFRIMLYIVIGLVIVGFIASKVTR